MELRFNLTRSDYKAFWRRSLTHPKTYKQVFSIWIIFLILVTLKDCEAFESVENWSAYSLRKVSLAGGITLVAMAIFLFRWRKYPLFNGPEGSCILNLRADRFTLTDAKGVEQFFPIDRMRFISENRDLFFLYFGNRDGFPLPKNAFPDPKLADAFSQLMEKVKKENLPHVAEEAIMAIFEKRR